MIQLTFAAGFAFLAALSITPLVRRLAPRVGLIDQPDGRRKLHGSGTPLGGGIALALATAVTLLSLRVLFTQFGWDVRDPDWWVFGAQHFGVGLACLVILFVGLADDRWNLRGRQKLAGQVAAALILVGSGLVVKKLSILGYPIELGIIAVPFTVFWLLGAINSLNLIDGADGMAGTVGFSISVAIAAMAWLMGNQTEALVAAALSGALLGFLVFNFPPASIFLGDTGSMLIGLLLGALSMRSSLKGPATVALAAPLALFAIPILDSLAAILRRRLTGRSIYSTDRGHIHHCLLRKGMDHRVMLLWIAAICASTSACAFMSVYWGNEAFALIGALFIIGALVTSGIFGHAEVRLLAAQLLGFLDSLVPRRGSKKPAARQTAVRLQGFREWDTIWEALTEFAELHNLCGMKLDVNVAWLHEGYHATWRQHDIPEATELWFTRLPIAMNNRTIGRLEVSGRYAGESMYAVLGALAELLNGLEDAFDRLASEPTVEHQSISVEGAETCEVLRHRPQLGRSAAALAISPKG